MARIAGEAEAPALPRHFRGWLRSWPRSGTISSDFSRGNAMHSTETVSSTGKETRIERGGMRLEEERHLAVVGRRMGSAEGLSMTAEVPLGGVGGMGETLEVRHQASRATALGDPRLLGVILQVREKARAKGRWMVRRPGSQSAAPQRRWINSGRHSWLPRAPRRGTRKSHDKGRCRSSVDHRHAARYQEEH